VTVSIENNLRVREWFRDRRILILGLGKSGVAAAGLLKRLGARVAVSEKRTLKDVRPWIRSLPSGVSVETGSHGFLSRAWDRVVVSPGVPNSLWRPLQARGVPVWGELELGYRVLSLAGRWPRCSAAITGTNGKTTTTALLGAIFRASGRLTVEAGNIGVPLCSILNKLTSESALVLEVSSYQLETTEAFRPSVGAVLNVTPDHLARHGTLEVYAETKFRLFQAQGIQDVAVLNKRDPSCRRLASRVPGTVCWFGESGRSDFYWDGKYLRGKNPSERWKAPAFLPGRHNIENALAAVACAKALGVSARSIARGLAEFPGVEHRLEWVRTWRGIRFVNDSKATNVDSTRVALEALPGPLTVILGGQDKGSPYTPLRPLLRKKAKEILLIGEATPPLQRDLGGLALFPCGTLERAVERAAQTARPGDTVLLSPACASFDQFENFEHRGRCFKERVAALP
jgi:UDP-N-acetylmuramoylalanine--D-glutamate ligase